MTNSPSLKLRLGDKVSLNKLLNLSKPHQNEGFTFLFVWFKLFIVSGSTVGGGNIKASKPGKKRKMLPATPSSVLLSASDETCPLKT